jgi:hypothetical protein
MHPPADPDPASLLGGLRARLRRRSFYFHLSQVAKRAVDMPRGLERGGRRAREAWTRAQRWLRSTPPRDLRSRITVAVTTVGRPTCAQVLDALEQQDCEFQGPVVLRDISPWPRAFNEMFARSTTPYTVQVDEDMVLKPHAIRALLQRIEDAPASTAMVCFPLWDTASERTIQGVKVWRSDVLRQHPYRAGPVPWKDLVARLEAAGHEIHVVQPQDYLGREVLDDPQHPEVLGEHRVQGSRLLFERFYSLCAAYRTTSGLEDVPYALDRLLTRLGLDSTDEDLWALLGAAAGLANPAAASDYYQRRRLLPGYRELRALAGRGPQEVSLLVGLPETPDAGPLDLRRLRLLFETVEVVRVTGPGDPLGRPALREIVDELRTSSLRLVVERDAGPLPPGAERILEPLGARAELVERALDVVPGRDPGSLGSPRRGLELGLTREALLAPGDSLLSAVREARGRYDWVLVEPAPPTAIDSAEDQLWADDEAVAARWSELQEGLLGVRFGPLVPRGLGGEVPSCCESPFRSLAVNGRGELSGCSWGWIQPAPEHWSIYFGDARELWYERHLKDLRAELSGKAPLRWPCSACSRNA